MRDGLGNSAELDAQLFTAIHQTLHKEMEQAQHAEGFFPDRRSSQRFPFRTVQMAACADTQSIPPSDAFQRIECYDISCGGFSYLSPRLPDGEQLVVILQEESNSFWLRSRVVYTRNVTHHGENLFLIGCQFTERVNISS